MRCNYTLFFNLGARWWGVVINTPRTLSPGNYPVPVVQSVGWAPRPVWMSTENPPELDPQTVQPVASRLNYPGWRQENISDVKFDCQFNSGNSNSKAYGTFPLAEEIVISKRMGLSRWPRK